MATRRKPHNAEPEPPAPPPVYPQENDPIPKYRIDLALPPQKRYVELARDFAPGLQQASSLFQEILDFYVPNKVLQTVIRGLARVLLLELRDAEQTQEIRGISKVSGVDMWLLVAINVLLDLLLGCTSGAARVGGEEGGGGDGERERLLHFRTLDWGMDKLRELLVELEFVDSSSEKPHEVLARSVTYAGFVGVLTGVRQDLSLSLNFRPAHSSKGASNLRWHQLMVLLGHRESIASTLRKVILRPRPAGQSAPSVAEEIAATRTTPCYLILCDGDKGSALEKDFLTGDVRSDADFVVQTNHDVSRHAAAQEQMDAPAAEEMDAMAKKDKDKEEKEGAQNDESWVEESAERMQCMLDFWKEKTEGDEGRAHLTEEEVVEKMRGRPISREWTHFRCVMDPKRNSIIMLERGPPPKPKEEEETQTEE